jgi:hypothetical protein
MKATVALCQTTKAAYLFKGLSRRRLIKPLDCQNGVKLYAIEHRNPRLTMYSIKESDAGKARPAAHFCLEGFYGHLIASTGDDGVLWDEHLLHRTRQSGLRE